MNNNASVEGIFPPISPLNVHDLPERTTYVGAAGFEDRALSVLDRIKWHEVNAKIKNAIAIHYEPFDERNKDEEMSRILAEVGLSNEDVTWMTYNRYKPGEFVEALAASIEAACWGGHVLLDISAMSKLLIVLIAQELRKLSVPVTVAYGEAEIYHPTVEEYEQLKAKIPEVSPGFLTSDVYRVVTTESVSSVAMDGFPLVLIAFSTFNYRELVALVTELTPEPMVLLEGIPHEPHNRWRLEAIHWINRVMKDDATETAALSTFGYRETLDKLHDVYNRYQYTHKVVVAPTGSKFQSLGVWFFKQMHPDVQIVYPITSKFVGAYTEGCKALWEIRFPNFSRFSEELGSHGKASLQALRKAIKSARAGY